MIPNDDLSTERHHGGRPGPGGAECRPAQVLPVLTNSSWDSDDLVQDTWIKALEHLQQRSHANPEALLLRIAKNTWIDRVRRDQTYRRILDEKLEHVLPKEEASNEDSKLNIEFAFQLLLEHLSPAANGAAAS